MIRRSAKWSFRLGVLVAIALVVKKMLDSKGPTLAPVVPTPPRPVPEPKPAPVPTPKPEPVAVVEPASVPEPEAEAAIPEPEPAPAPAPEPAKKAAKAAKRPPRTEPLRAQRLSKQNDRPVRANRKVALDAPAGTHSVMVSWVEPVGDVCPTSHPIKAKLGSKVFRKPSMASYKTSKPDRCYASEGAARRAGFTEAQR